MKYLQLAGCIAFVAGLVKAVTGEDLLTALLIMAAGGAIFMLAYLRDDPGPIK